MSENIRWITGTKLMEKWKLDYVELFNLIRKKGLKSYNSIDLELTDVNELLKKISKYDRFRNFELKRFISELRFKSEDVEKYEKKYKELSEPPNYLLSPSEKIEEIIKEFKAKRNI